MEASEQHERAAAFRRLHVEGPVVLPNAWDAMSAVMVIRAGAPAVATTSAGVAWSRGRRDGGDLGRVALAQAVTEIAAVVPVPLSVDVEDGYGRSPDEVERTVAEVVAAGAVGVNLEDVHKGVLLPSAEQCARLDAVKSVARELRVDVFLNARTDVFLSGGLDLRQAVDEVVGRSVGYAEAGADCLFVPGVADIGVITELVRRCRLPLNVMAGPGAPSVRELSGVGVRRISVGAAVAQAAYSLAERAARELLGDGTYGGLGDAMAYAELNELLS